MGCKRDPPAVKSAPEEQQSYPSVRADYFRGDLPEVIRRAKIGAKQHSSADTPEHWEFRLIEAEALLDQGNGAQALPLLAEPAPPAYSQIEVRRLIDTAGANAGNPTLAGAALQTAHAEATDVELRIRLTYAEGLMVLASQPALAERHFEESQHLAEATPGYEYYAAQDLVGRCFLSKQERRYSEALRLGKQALALADTIGAQRVRARALLNLGYLYGFLGNNESAVDSEKQAVVLFAKIGDEPNHARALGELAHVLGMQRQPAQAIERGQEAYALAKCLRMSPADLRRIAGNLALAFVDLREWDQAEQWNKLADPTSVYFMRNEADIARARGQRERFFTLCRQVLAQATTPAIQWQVYVNMAQAYTDVSDFNHAFIEYEHALGVFENARSEANDIEKVSFLARLIDLYQGYADALIRAGQPEKALEIIESSRARVLADQFGGGARNKKITPPARTSNTVILSFWIAPAPRQSFAWLLSREGTRRFALPPEEKIAAAVAEYKEKTEKSFKDPLSANYGQPSPLWDMLLKDAAANIPQGTRVVVIPDGPLHQLNLETLVSPLPHPHYWLEDVEVVIAPSLALAPMSAAKNSTTRRGAGPEILLIGAPDYSGTTYPELKYAHRELVDIQAKFPNPPPRLFEGVAATPQAYLKSRPGQYAMIHFAAHAVADSTSPLESAVLLSRSGDDYRLLARDIYKLPIHADLVTVDACHSAGSKAYAGEGLIGFAWAFLASGAHHVIAGLWDVDDQSTARLMAELYTGIAAGLDPVAALHKAKLKLMHENPKPYYWAPLQIYSAAK